MKRSKNTPPNQSTKPAPKRPPSPTDPGGVVRNPSAEYRPGETAFARKVRLQGEAQSAHRQAIAAKDAEIAQLKREREESDLEWIAMTRAKMANLDKIATTRLVNKLINTSRKRHTKDKPFRPYDVIATFIAKNTKTLAPATAVSGTVPTSNQDGTLPAPKQARTFQEIVEERERYRKRLKELGLEDPTMGSSGSNPGGLGY